MTIISFAGIALVLAGGWIFSFVMQTISPGCIIGRGSFFG